MVFGDLFRQRADYSKGLFYSGRNGIFSQNTSLKVHPEGPQIIRKSTIISSTKDRTSAEATPSLENSSVDLKVMVEPQVADIDKRKLENTLMKYKPDECKPCGNVLTFAFAKDSLIRQRSLKKRSKTIVIENNWKQELFGGVKTWVNQATGEVSLGDPRSHPQSPNLKAKGRSKTVDSRIRQFFPWRSSEKDEDRNKRKFRLEITFSGKFHGSNESSKGSYRNPEMKELFDLLDGTKGESEKIVSTSLQA